MGGPALTSIAVYGSPVDPRLLSTARAHGVRVLLVCPAGCFGTDARALGGKWGDEAFVRGWVSRSVGAVRQHGAGGIFLDIEASPLNATQATQLTAMVRRLADSLRAAQPGSLLAMAAFQLGLLLPHCGATGLPDYAGLARAVDRLVVMNYDANPWRRGGPDDFANAPLFVVNRSLHCYGQFGVDAKKLLLAFPWYGFAYTCAATQSAAATPTEELGCNATAARTVGWACPAPNCSGVAGCKPHDSGSVPPNHSDAFVLTGATDYEEYCMQRMIDSAVEKRWDARTETPYAYFRGAQGELNRLDYDDCRSLGLKYRLAEAAGAAGVAMWTANGVGDAKAPSAAQFWRGIPRVSAQLKTDDASVASVVPARIPTVGGQAVTVTLALPAPTAVAAWCRVGPAAGGYSLAWPAADDVEPSPDKWQLVVPAEVLNQSSVRCTPPPTAVPGPGLLSVTVNGGANWTAGAPIMYYELVHASLDRRPYIREDKARLMLGSDRVLSGAVLRVSVSLPAANASWQFTDVPGGSDVMLPLPLDALPPAIHNDMQVVVALPDGRNVTLWTRMLRTPPPAAGSGATAVQVDMASGGGLLLNGQKWNAAGWYMAMSTPRSQAIPSLANLSAHMQTMARSGVNLMYLLRQTFLLILSPFRLTDFF